MNAAPQESPLRVVLGSERFVVIDKPAGMLSVPGKGEAKQDCAAARVRSMFPHSSGPLVVHRLDMETSGLLVFGLDPDAQRDLSAQFEHRSVVKHYIALLEGEPRTDSGVIELPLRADVERRPMQIVDRERGRPALTRWSVVAREIDRTRVRFEPLTGRTHQLRVHAAEGIQAPIVGDVLYGRGDGTSRLMLHASFLAFREPGGERRIACESAPGF